VDSLTWPPLKPTATTPRSWRSGRNFAWCGGGAVILADGCGRCQFAIVVERVGLRQMRKLSARQSVEDSEPN
jgi:hypothetical protein